ncbi:MAG: DinB family protein [Bacteroidetes bacterium]|nr:DinB family protein [Bacteroidota bacterium]
MKRHILKLTILLLCSGMTSQLVAQENPFVSDFIERLENSQKYLVVVAETMPEDIYNFKVSSESLTFAENLLHIGYALDWHSQSLLGGREGRVWKTDTVFKTANKSKKEMIETVTKVFDEAIDVLRKFDPDQLDDELDYFGLTRSKRQIFLLLTDHITHHRGQMLVSMRLNGLVPPRYVLFQ